MQALAQLLDASHEGLNHARSPAVVILDAPKTWSAREDCRRTTRVWQSTTCSSWCSDRELASYLTSKMESGRRGVRSLARVAVTIRERTCVDASAIGPLGGKTFTSTLASASRRLIADSISLPRAQTLVSEMPFSFDHPRLPMIDRLRLALVASASIVATIIGARRLDGQVYGCRYGAFRLPPDLSTRDA